MRGAVDRIQGMARGRYSLYATLVTTQKNLAETDFQASPKG